DSDTAMPPDAARASAGTGVLPAPFGRSGAEPTPAASVVADGNADGPAPGTREPGRDASHGKPGDPRASHGPGASASAGPGPSASPDGRPDRPGGGPSATSTPGETPGKGDGKGTDKNGTGRSAWALRVCRDYLAAGTARRGKGIDDDALRILERTAGSANAVRAYCERLLGDAGSGSGSGSGGASGGDDDRDTGGLLGGSGSTPGTRSMPQVPLPGLSALQGVTLSGAVTL
ncbi:hypothetical protein AB0K09_29925, partial [Streptomyces sp. NPDC049577]